MNPYVSVLLPTFNGDKTLLSAIKSVLKQSFKNLELVVIDDGSKFKAKEILKTMAKNDNRLRIHENKLNLGIVKSLNIGLSLSRGKYIARIDDDDLWLDKNKLKKQIEFLENNKDYALVGTLGKYLSTDKIYEVECEDKQIRNNILSKNQFIHSSVLFKKLNYTYPTNHLHNEDWGLWMEILKKYKAANLNKRWTGIKTHKGSIMSKSLPEQIKYGFRLVLKYKNSFPNGNIQMAGYILSSMIRITKYLSLKTSSFFSSKSY